MPKYKLIDFNNRDRAEVMRFVFNLAEVTFDDVKFELPSEEWDEYKKRTHFGELPILEVDGTPLIKDRTILGYLAREFEYYGESNWECTLIDCIVDTCEEFHGPTDAIFHTDGADKEELIKYFRDHTVPKVLDTVAILAEHNQNKEGFIIGDNLTIADLVVCYSIELAIDVTKVPAEDLLKNYHKLTAWRSRLFKNEKIKSWVDGLFAVFVQQDSTDVNKPSKSPSKCVIM